MPKHNSEDAQPNEIRLMHKGHPVIPSIQPSGSQKHFHPQAGPYRRTNHYARSQSLIPPFSAAPRTFPINPGQSRPNKRRRTEDTSIALLQQKPVQSHPSLPPKPQAQHPPRVEIIVHLPIHCRHGVAGYKKSRRDWLNVEIPRVEKERGVKIYGHNIEERTLCFFAHTVGHESCENPVVTGDCHFVPTCGQH